MERTLQAITASTGNLAERLLCDSRNVYTALSKHFGMEVKSIRMVPGRRKADNIIELADNTKLNFQNKNGKVDGRGHSVNRSPIDMITTDETLRTLLRNVCLEKTGDRPEVSVERSREIISKCFLGDLEFRPDYFTYTKIISGQISELWICPTSVLHGAILADLYEKMIPKRTCVHLSPSIYLQRKGGGAKDHSPNDIQVKFRLAPYMNLFTRLF